MKMNTKNIVIASSVSLLVLISAACGFTTSLRKTSYTKKYISWMSKIDDSTSLRNINIPGSHDTMALYSIGDLAGQCQTLNLKEQLNLGIRFLDIRLQNDHDSLKAVHGFIDQRASFKSIVNDVETFLDKNPSEFIFMSIKEEADAKNSTLSFEDTLKKYVSTKWVVDNEIPSNIGEVRGKIVLLSRYSNSTIGINAYDGWEDSTSFVLDNHDIYVQDFYKVDTVNNKKSEINRCMLNTAHELKINFLSGYLEKGFPPSYAPSVANSINPWINKNINSFDNRGIVLYDFVSEKNIEAWFK